MNVNSGDPIRLKPFRTWVQRIWYANSEEHLTYGELPYTIQQYWSKYKWWLRREYKFRRANNSLDKDV